MPFLIIKFLISMEVGPHRKQVPSQIPQPFALFRNSAPMQFMLGCLTQTHTLIKRAWKRDPFSLSLLSLYIPLLILTLTFSFSLCSNRKNVLRRSTKTMGEGKGSTLVHLLAVVLCLVAFGFAIAAERRRSTVNTLLSL